MGTANDLINIAVGNATEMRDSANSALGEALGRLSTYSVFTPASLALNTVGSAFDLGTVPQFSGQHYVEPTKDFGAAPGMQPIPAPEYGTAPVNTATKRPYTAPQKPSPLRVFDGTLPTLNELVIPPPPDINLDVQPPTLTEIVVPPAPSVVLPEFMAVRPETDLTAPEGLVEKYERDYANMSVNMRNALDGAMDAHLTKINPEYHTQLAAMEAKLTQYLAGGTALPVEVEQAIYNRALDKTHAEHLKAREQIMREGAQRGFTIPGGAMYSTLAQSRQAAADNNARAAMDIAVKQAEMEQQNIQFAMTQSANLRMAVMQAMVSWFGNLIQLNGQALEYAKNVLGAAIALYDILVKIATAQIEIYKAEAQVYEIRLRAVLAVYDVYQAEIKALEAQVNIDRAKVDAYKARVESLGVLANVYKSVIDGVLAQAQIEKIKADIFGEEVRAFSAEVGAKQGEWQAFTAQVQGEVAQQNVYGEEVRAYGIETQAYATKISAYNSHVQALSTQNEGAARVYQAAVSAYSALVQGASVSAKAEIDSFESTLKGYIATANAEEARVKANIAADEANARNLIGLYQAGTAAAQASSNGYNDYMLGAANVATHAAQVYAGMASSAMAGVSSLGADIASESK